jgi:predicted nucleic acid-binding protein
VKILIDTNLFLDVALKRQPFLADSAKVLDWTENNPKHAAIAWHSVSNIAYLLQGNARDFLSDLLVFMEVAAGDTATVRQALGMQTRDFEDALQAAAALEFGADLIVTRNPNDFKKLPIAVMTPAVFVQNFMGNT